MSPRVAVVMVSFRTGPRLAEALDAALSAEGVERLVLVDNGNPPEVEAELDARAAREPRLEIIRGQGNVGFARACNLGAAAATKASPAPTHLLFLNPDAVLAPDAAPALVAAGNGRASPWIAGGRILDLEGREQRGGRRRAPTLARALGALVGGRADRMHLEGSPAPDMPVLVDAVSGACMLLSTEGFAQLGGFDEGYFLHVEDLDICRRAQEAGGDVIYVPAAVCRHAGGTSDAPKLFVEWCKGRGLARYFVRFARGPLEQALAVAAGPLVVAAAVARGAVRRRRGAGERSGRSAAHGT